MDPCGALIAIAESALFCGVSAFRSRLSRRACPLLSRLGSSYGVLVAAQRPTTNAMDLSFTPAEESFRTEVRETLRRAMPPDLAAKAARYARFDHADTTRWHRILHSLGWGAIPWPVEHGGPDLTATERYILLEELDRAGAPELSPFGLVMIGPLLQRYGTEAQKTRYLPPIVRAEEHWCQGYSEPGAGSDLASLRTEAVDAGDRYVVTGQKTWTTAAEHADFIFLLVRTDPKAKKQEGISFLLVDMKSPGIEIRPMKAIDGTYAFCDTFFDHVEVPKENLLGAPNQGWTLAKSLLGNERNMPSRVGLCHRALRRAKSIARETLVDGAPLLDDPLVRRRIARLEVRLSALTTAKHRVLAELEAGKPAGPEASVFKVVGTELLQELEALCMELMGLNALCGTDEVGLLPPTEETVASWTCYHRAASIYAGSNEIQRTVLAREVLGLPPG